MEDTHRLIVRVKGSTLLDVILEIGLRGAKGVVAQH